MGLGIALAILAGAPASAGEPDGGQAGEARQQIEDVSLEDLLEVVVTATKEEQSADEVPTIVSVITREQIVFYGYQSVAQALASVPGVFVNTDYVFEDIGLRGISGELRGGSRLVKIMIDGQPIPFRSENTTFTGPELIPMEAVERIEVIRGPESAFYGAGAFLGVVNIITRPGSKVKGGSFALTGSIFGDGRLGGGLGLIIGDRLGPFDVMVAYSRRREDRSGLRLRCTTAIAGEQPCDNATSVTRGLLDRPSFDDVANPSALVATAKVGLGELLTTAHDLGQLELLGSVQWLDSRGSFSDWGSLNYTPVLDVAGRVVGGVEGSGNRVGLYNGALRGRYHLSVLDGMANVDVRAAHARGGVSDAERLVETSGPASRSGYGFEGTDLSAELRLRPFKRLLEAEPAAGRRKWISDLGLLVGADLTDDRVSLITSGASSDHVRVRLRNIGAFGQLTGSFVDGRIQLLGGLRYDQHRGAQLAADLISGLDPEARDRLCDGRVCYEQLSYGIGASALVLKNALARGDGFWINQVFVKAFTGNSFQAPSPTFLYSYDQLGERPINPNPALRPQNVASQQVQVGVDGVDKRVSLAATAFHNFLRRRAELSKQGQAVVAANGVSIESFGLEAELRLHFDPVTVYGNLSVQSSRRLLGANPDARIEETFAYPGLMSVNGATVAIGPMRSQLNVELQFTGSRVGHFVNRSDRLDQRYVLAPYLLVNLNLVSSRWMFFDEHETRLALGVRNLFDARYEYPGFQPYYRYDIPGTPRTVTLTLSQDL